MTVLRACNHDGMPTGGGTCRARGCQRAVGEGRFFCLDHYRMLPKKQTHWLANMRRIGPLSGFDAALRDCVEHIATREGR